MDEFCAGCFPEARKLEADIGNVRKQAFKYGQENKKTVAVYREGKEFRYAEASFAIGKYPIVEVLQYHPHAAAI